MSSVVQAAGVAMVAAAATGWLVATIRRWALRKALLDLPNSRSSHSRATPRLGGVAIALVLLCGLAILAMSPLASAQQRWALLVLACTGAGVAIVSLLDDVRPLPAVVRLLVHLVGAVVTVALVTPPGTLDGGVLGRVMLAGALAAVLMVLWIGWFINAFNFMDGIDGIAGGQAGTAGLGWAVLGLLTATPTLTIAGALLAGTSAGFLVHNWSPARIFMGDAGSATLGYLLATVPWALGGEPLWIPSILLVWPFVFDALLTLCRRALRGERVWEAHRSHLYQRLVVRGGSHRATAMVYIALAVLGLACAVTVLTGPVSLARAMVFLVVLAGTGLAVVVTRVEARSGAVRVGSDA